MSGKTVVLSQFQGKDFYDSLALAMAYLRENPYSTLVIEPGKYVLTSELARETQRAVMAGEYGPDPQPTMFHPKFPFTKGMDLRGQKGTKIMGYGVTIMVDGFMEPIALNYCEDVEICGLTIDHVRKPYSKGYIKSLTPVEGEEDAAVMEVELIPEHPIQKETPYRLRYCSYDADRDRLIRPRIINHEILDPHHVRCDVIQTKGLKVGQEFYSTHAYHSRPVILVEYAKNITITDITIHSQPGMGIVGNRSEDVLIRRLAVIPSLGDHFSTNTDATHFTSMKGLLRFEDCVAEGQGDDFTNVHAYYHDVVKREAPNVVYLQEKTPDGTHAQTLDYPDVGDEMELTNKKSLLTMGCFRVVACEPMHEEWMCKVTFDRDLPEDLTDLVLADITRLPRLEVVGCMISSHFARSILMKIRNALIERNFFKYAMGVAIEAAAEAWWYEGVTPANIIIRNNRIIGCGGTGVAGIEVKADSDEAKGQSIYNIVIEDNIIEAPQGAHAIYVRNTDGVKIARNKCLVAAEPLVILDSTNVDSDMKY